MYTPTGASVHPAFIDASALVSLSLLSTCSGTSGRIRSPALHNVDVVGLQPDSGPKTTFFRFRDAFEVKDGVPGPVSGWGLAHALPARANHKIVIVSIISLRFRRYRDLSWDLRARTRVLDQYYHQSGGNNLRRTFVLPRSDKPFCFLLYASTRRAFNWTVCNELCFFPAASPSGHVGLQHYPTHPLCKTMHAHVEVHLPQSPIPDMNGTNSR